ncbi:MAG: hypothetical protein US71_C0002G0030 [Parcubacteria group bacterium GW2011_GWD2_38_12]|nr:MAG: hypothetical protein US06_C0003G0028 [Parcubacteria group bacterium GW2011_GWC2_36_17]KKQ43700.1 MAG: hypothetical protein US61_C0005G0013 [Parcubacteria group bacterium GW2011_GWE2_37_8]KKQ52633.1 MAG: hypothetical protein US71_C0002G0030 [Parcubacteria group bacterium GW2011_GWD2_38_12]KKQ58848.1 MAG: hypothetical protein US79_C0002G0036 [Parcubacteria group bacterium GW2011_GWC1_38_17]KKQ59586.1 MAG: hypothetical protein US78_C0002G0049 [Parcubacteria group bacterium GW2011_GWD1_38_1
MGDKIGGWDYNEEKARVKKTNKGAVEVISYITLTVEEMEYLKTLCYVMEKPLQDVIEKAVRYFISSSSVFHSVLHEK